MNIDGFLSRLDKVKSAGADDWSACCPAHADRYPSLAVHLESDGRILIHCFAGCETLDVLKALGLAIEDLFPERLTDERYRPLRRKFSATAVLDALAHEALIVLLCSRTMLEGKSLEPQDHERLLLASSRIEEGNRLANG